MKRFGVVLFILFLFLALCACKQLSPGSESEKRVENSRTSLNEPASAEGIAAPIPGEALTEEEQIAMWNALMEKMAEDDLTAEDALQKAVRAKDLLSACGAELLALDLPNRDESWTAVPLYGNWMVLYQALSRSLTDFESDNCRLLLDLGIVEAFHIDKDMVQFSIGGRGFGPETEYFDVYYIPSDDITDCFGYSDKMTFTEQDGGWIGSMDDPRDDNTFFYKQIGEHLYFCAAHF